MLLEKKFEMFQNLPRFETACLFAPVSGKSKDGFSFLTAVSPFKGNSFEEGCLASTAD